MMKKFYEIPHAAPKRFKFPNYTSCETLTDGSTIQ